MTPFVASPTSASRSRLRLLPRVGWGAPLLARLDVLMAIVCVVCVGAYGPPAAHAAEGEPAEARTCVRREKLPSVVEWDVGEQVVADRAACLMWTRSDFKLLTGRFTRNWDEAMQWAREMNEAGYAGFSDWRVPSIAEYRTIAGRLPYRKSFYADGEFAYWARNEINRWVASYYMFDEPPHGTSGSKDPVPEWSKPPWKFSVRLVRTLP